MRASSGRNAVFISMPELVTAFFSSRTLTLMFAQLPIQITAFRRRFSNLIPRLSLTNNDRHSRKKDEQCARANQRMRVGPPGGGLADQPMARQRKYDKRDEQYHNNH